MADFFNLETHAGQPIETRFARITPFARSLTLKLPGRSGGFVLNLPASVLVQTADGQEEAVPIVFVSQILEWAILISGISLGLVFWLRNRKQDKSKRRK